MRKAKLDPRLKAELKRLRSQREYEENKKNPVAYEMLKEAGQSDRPSPEALYDLYLRMNAPRTINMILLGDPVVPRWMSNAA